MAARKKLILPFLLPTVVLIVVFFIWPTIQTVQLSFLDWHLPHIGVPWRAEL